VSLGHFSGVRDANQLRLSNDMCIGPSSSRINSDSTFMAIETILSSFSTKSPRNYYHDLGLFFYVFLFMAICLREKKERCTISGLLTWITGTSAEQIRRKQELSANLRVVWRSCRHCLKSSLGLPCGCDMPCFPSDCRLE